MLPNEKLYNLMKVNQLFRGLTDKQLAPLVDLAGEENYNKGDYIMHEGDSADKFYIIKSGQVEISKKSLKGNQIFSLRTLTNGDVIGEIGLTALKKRSAFVKATTPVTLISFPIESFNKQIDLETRYIISQNTTKIEVERLAFAYDFTIENMRNELIRSKKVQIYQVSTLILVLGIIYYLGWIFLFTH